MEKEKKEEIVFIHRLREVMIRDIEKKIGGMVSVNSETTDIQAGFMLGVQYVLGKLRDGYCEESQN